MSFHAVVSASKVCPLLAALPVGFAGSTQKSAPPRGELRDFPLADGFPYAATTWSGFRGVLALQPESGPHIFDRGHYPIPGD